MLKERWPNTPEDGKIKNIQQLESSPCAVRLQEFILLGVAKGQQRGDLVGVRGDICFAGWLEKLRQVWRLEAGG